MIGIFYHGSMNYVSFCCEYFSFISIFDSEIWPFWHISMKWCSNMVVKQSIYKTTFFDAIKYGRIYSKRRKDTTVLLPIQNREYVTTPENIPVWEKVTKKSKRILLLPSTIVHCNKN